MKRIVLLMCLIGLFVVAAYGQETVFKAEIPFNFVAGEKAMPAGSYTFQSQDPTTMLVRNVKTGDAVYVTVLTRLSQAGEMKDPVATFDEHEGKMMLEAVWPITEDGYLLRVTRGRHTHKVVKMT